MPGRDRSARRTAWLGMILLVLVVAGFVLLLERPSWEARSITRVSGSTDSATLAVTVAHSQCGNGGPRVHVEEQTPEVVALRADHDVSGDCDDIGLRTKVEIELDDPLGGRRIRVAPPQAHEGLECIIDGAPSDVCT